MVIAVLGAALVAVSLPSVASALSRSAPRWPDDISVETTAGGSLLLDNLLLDNLLLDTQADTQADTQVDSLVNNLVGIADPGVMSGTPRSLNPQQSATAAAQVPPVRLLIPAIDVDAPVLSLGLRADGHLEVPKQPGATGWYEGGPAPGVQGAALIVGHLDSTKGPEVFHRLERLRPGALITVRRADGSTVRFSVDRLESHLKNDFPTARVFGDVRGPELRLVTCFGSFDRDRMSYRSNLVVFATFVPPTNSPRAQSRLRVVHRPQEENP